MDRIAAGEVVERPAAVVKELVENALDAGAGKIRVLLEAGGRKLIKVEDDGEGIPRDDLERAFLRHATSKLSQVEELFHIASLGFRGEALASIGAVSRARITSRVPGKTEGASVENEGGAVSKIRPAGCPPGTTVEVKNLFYNVPPRLKFLKKESTELSHCVECLTRFALAYPDVAFSLNHNGRQVFRAERSADDLDRIATFFGKEVKDNLIPVSREVLGIRFEGHLGRPGLGRRDMRRSYLFLNGRFIKDKAAHAALSRAFREVMPEKLHPTYFLHIGMPPDWVDVNVHPTKIEVRFIDGARVFSATYRVAAEALASEERLQAAVDRDGPMESLPQAGRISESAQGFGAIAAETVFQKAKSFPSIQGELVAPTPERKILQIHDTYALFETPNGFTIVDQHALHERLLYERLRREYEAGGIRLQLLLVPVIVELEPDRAARDSEICEGLDRLGLKAESFGRGTLKITAVPALLKSADPRGLVLEVIDRVAEGEMGEEVYQKLLHGMACRAAVKAGRRMEREELEALLKSAEGIDFSGRCPHGRPTMVTFTVKELEELFKRRGF